MPGQVPLKLGVGWVYDLILRVFAAMVDCFFRDVQTRGARHVPTEGSVILVAAPHANQVRISHMTPYSWLHPSDVLDSLSIR